MVAGKPHLGTDRLIRILQAFRKHLKALGVCIHFGACVTDLVLEQERAVGVRLAGRTTTTRLFQFAHAAVTVFTSLSGPVLVTFAGSITAVAGPSVMPWLKAVVS